MTMTLNRTLTILVMAGMVQAAAAQRVLNLDSCRALAMRNNKQISVQRVKQEVTANLRKSARTKYLPHVSAIGGYEYTSKEVSILNNDQKDALAGAGTNMSAAIQEKVAPYMQLLPAPMQQQMGTDLMRLAGLVNAGGQHVVDAFRTDSRNVFGGAVVLTQPVFMGGAIVALNKMADISEQMAANSAEAGRQQTLYDIDQAYWQVVSLHNKQKLAESYYDLVKKLDGDVQKMIEEGVATRSEGLSVAVKVNEAEMTLTKVNDGLVLSRMLLCQLCGLPLDEQVTLADENEEFRMKSGDALARQSGADSLSGSAGLAVEGMPAANSSDFTASFDNRPELKLLQNTVDMTRQTTNLLKAGNLPQVALTGGYAFSSPNVFNGFEKKFAGFWNIGVLVRIPVWNWGDVMYKVRASKGATAIAQLELEEAREKIALQVNQRSFQLTEAGKRLEMANASTARADENLRTANLGFREGVISAATVMEAQTAWLQAQSQKVDAEIDVRLSRVNLKKALGVMTW